MRRVNINKRYKRKKSNFIVTHIQNNIKEYVIACIIFFIGILLGIVLINNLNEIQINEITEYITKAVTELKEDNTINMMQMLQENIKQDIVIVVFLWIMGSTVIGLLLVYIIVCFKGFSLGCAISSIIYVLRKK